MTTLLITLGLMTYALCGLCTGFHFARYRLHKRGCLDIRDVLVFPFAVLLWPIPVGVLWLFDDLELPVIYRRKP